MRSAVGLSLVMAAAALGAVVALVLDHRGRESSAPAEPPAQVAPRPAEPHPAEPQRALSRVRDAAPAGRADAAFWHVVDEAHDAAGSDTSRQSELVKEELTGLSPHAIVAFAQTRHRMDRRAYTWQLWGAANVIEDGCSDDCFRDFRAYLISLGRDTYERALRDADSLASVAQDAEAGDWENADNVAPDAYASVSGNDFPLDDSDLSGAPAGTPIDLNDTAAVRRRYPRLAARFRR